MIKRFVAITLFVLLVIGLLVIVFASPAGIAEVSIVFTHDLHAHFDPESLISDGVIAERGGYSRMKTAIDLVRDSYPETFILDAGDFSMGTLYQTIYSEEAPDLRLLGFLGYDAVTLGNHEFDYRTQGITDMLRAAVASGDKLPAIAISNIDWDKTLADESRFDRAGDFRKAMVEYGAFEDYLIINKGGVKAAIFGLMGIESESNAPESGLFFADPIETAKSIVSQIKANTDADIIICLSHGGTDSNPKKSEDELLAKAVSGIDVIISGHSHTKLMEPVVVGETVIVSTGEHSYDIGHLRLMRDGGKFRVSGYDIIPISKDLSGDHEVDEMIREFRGYVERDYLSLFGYGFDQVLAVSGFNFTPVESFGKKQGEEPLGNVIADAYIAAVKKSEGAEYSEISAAVAPYGVIRGAFTAGEITVADAFVVSSLGIGPDRIPGYPLVSMYLTGSELKTIAEIDISVSTLMSAARLYISGLSYTYNPNRLILNRVTDTRLMDEVGNMSVIDDNRLYRVVSGLYSCQMLGAVEAQSFGLLKVTPKDASGVPIEDYEKYIIYDSATGMELKEWIALAQYLESFEPVDGIATIPDQYTGPMGRKIEETSWSPVALLKSPNKIFFIVAGVGLLVLVILFVPTFLIIRRVRRKQKRSV